jgi:hypothetical protein
MHLSRCDLLVHKFSFFSLSRLLIAAAPIRINKGVFKTCDVPVLFSELIINRGGKNVAVFKHGVIYI